MPLPLLSTPWSSLHSTSGEVWCWPGFIAPEETGALFDELLAQTPWQDESLRIHGKDIPLPRRTAWFGDPEAAYRYSGISNTPTPWTPALADIKARIEQATQASYNSVLLNLYRDGRDSVSWHADDERELGQTPTIASLSLGGPRKFVWKPKDAANRTRGGCALQDGDLLVMRGEFQQHWLHGLPKTARPVAPRINLTFRQIHPS